jgi:hypothetical protein
VDLLRALTAVFALISLTHSVVHVLLAGMALYATTMSKSAARIHARTVQLAARTALMLTRARVVPDGKATIVLKISMIV